jgi:hypothetical protein
MRLFLLLAASFVRAQLLFEWATNTPILFAHSSRRAADKDLICRRPALSYIYDIFRCAATFIVTIIIFWLFISHCFIIWAEKDNPGLSYERKALGAAVVYLIGALGKRLFARNGLSAESARTELIAAISAQTHTQPNCPE